MKKRIARIKRLHAEKGFDAVWHYCRDGEGKLERYKRWRAAQRWAKGHMEATKNTHEREQWNDRRKIYRRQKRRVLRKLLADDEPTLGTGSWAGSESIVRECVIKVYARHGIPVTSTKRWETFGNPSSDHYMGNTTAYAADAGVANAQWLHNEIANEFAANGLALSPRPYDYASCYCSNANGRWRYQGIATTHGTGPHHHGGVRRA